jgi:hypothetical protein
MQGSMHVSGTYRWLKKGGSLGVSIFEGGAGFPCQGVGSTLPPPASLPAAVGLNDLRIVPSRRKQAPFPVLFPRNVERDLVADENRRDLRRFLPGGWVLAEPHDEFAAPHSITSSARSRNASGIVSPSAFAVVRLMTRSNLVGCSTGMSAGFAPRRILST